MTIYLNNQEFDFGYFTKTTQRVLHLIQKTVLNGYTRQFKRNSNGDFNHFQNFFIYKKDNKKEYIRIILIRDGDYFNWSVEFSFKPFNYKHNHKEENHFKTDWFKSNDNKRYYEEFEECIEQVKRRIKENG